MITLLEHDGVRTLLAPATGPMRAGLVFPGGQVSVTGPEDEIARFLSGHQLVTPTSATLHLRRYGVPLEVTRENTVLWIAGDRVPPGLTLPLPAARRRTSPPVTGMLPPADAPGGYSFAGSLGTVAWQTVVTHSAPAAVLADVLAVMLGRSFPVATSYLPRSDGTAIITVIAAGSHRSTGSDAVLGEFIDVLAQLRVGRLDPADLPLALSHPDRPSASQPDRLPMLAAEMLAGLTPLSADQFQAVTPAAVAAVGMASMRHGLLLTPGDRDASWAGFAPAPLPLPLPPAPLPAGPPRVAPALFTLYIVLTIALTGLLALLFLDGDSHTTFQRALCALAIALTVRGAIRAFHRFRHA